MTTMLGENLAVALRVAIETQARRDREMGLDLPTGQVGGWSEILDALERGEEIWVEAIRTGKV